MLLTGIQFHLYICRRENVIVMTFITFGDFFLTINRRQSNLSSFGSISCLFTKSNMKNTDPKQI